MNIRPINEEDYPQIDMYIKQRSWERSGKQWVNLINPALIERVAKNKHPHIHIMIVEETYAVLFSVIKPWFTDKMLIEEKLIFKLFDGPGKFLDVVTALEHVAKTMGAVGILAGTALAPKDAVMVRILERQGFVINHVGLFKDTAMSNDIIGP
jgi:hypothetical protein